jgi:hypothetical protein
MEKSILLLDTALWVFYGLYEGLQKSVFTRVHPCPILFVCFARRQLLVSGKLVKSIFGGS